MKRDGKRHGRCIRPAATEGRDVSFGVLTLKARDDDDLSGIQCTFNRTCIDAFDARLRVGRIRMHAHLGAVVTHGFDADGL